MSDPQALWQQLLNAGVVTSPMPASTVEPPALFMRLLLGASGWFAALFFALFIATVFVGFLIDASQVWGLGLGLCALSLVLSRRRHSSVFMQQFILACSLAGQGLIIFSIAVNMHSSQLGALLIIALQVLLFIGTGISNQRSASTFIACCALLWLLGEQAWLYAVPIFSLGALGLWLYRSRLPAYANSVQPAATGLTLALWFSIALTLITHSSESFWGYDIPNSWLTHLWITALLSSAICLALAWPLIQHTVAAGPLRRLAICVGVGIALLNLKMPGIAPLILLFSIGVAQAHRGLIWLNLCCLIAYLLLYYYSLNDTLLYKSIVLCISASVLLILYGILNHYAQRPTLEQQHDA